MLGCVLGDLYGSKFEGGSSATRALPGLTEANTFTDDTVCTMAVIDHLLHDLPIREAFKQWVSVYPNAGYGRAFSSWARGILPEPVSSWGNGALMRISPVVLLSSTLEGAFETADAITSSTHSHPIARLAVRNYIELLWRALEGATRDDLLALWARKGGNIHTVESMHATGSPMRLRADETLEDVMSCLAESTSVDELLANCLYHGGDSDTIAAVAGPFAELLWGLEARHLSVITDNTDERVMAMLEALYTVARERSEADVEEPRAKELRAFIDGLENADWDALHDNLAQLVDVPLPNALLTQVIHKLSQEQLESVKRWGFDDTEVSDRLHLFFQNELKRFGSLDAWLNPPVATP